METSETGENLIQQLQPFFSVQRCLGFIFYELINQKEMRLTRNAKIHAAIMVVVHIALTARLLHLYSDLIDASVEMSLLEELSWFLYVIFDFSYFLMEYIWNKVYNNRMLRILNEFGGIEDDLDRCGIKLVYPLRSLMFVCLFYGIILMNHLLTLAYLEYTSMSNLLISLYRTFMFSWMTIGHTNLICNFVNVTFIARSSLKSLQHHLMMEFNNIPIKDWKRYSKILQDIFDSIRDFNRIISIRLLLCFGMMFWWLIINMFNFMMVVVPAKFSIQYISVTLYSVGIVVYCLVHLGGYTVYAEMYYGEVSVVEELVCEIG